MCFKNCLKKIERVGKCFNLIFFFYFEVENIVENCFSVKRE